MRDIFISNIQINKVRHLKELEIPLSKEQKKHLIITGKNGSGKTSLLDSISTFFNSILCDNDFIEGMSNSEIERKEASPGGVILQINQSWKEFRSLFQKGNFVVAYYKANRVFQAQVPKHIEKVILKNDYAIHETPREEFLKYLLDLKMTEALATASGKLEKANKIKQWFDSFEQLLKQIFENESVQLEFDDDTFQFHINIEGREPFDFNTLSSGYAAILDVVVDLMIRMEKQQNHVFDFSIPGIVLIDEIETHLHLELQKHILHLLTVIFPNIQFIVSTHSPFILNSLENVAIYDLETRVFVENGLSDIPYSGIVEGYFNTESMSMTLKHKFHRYKELVYKRDLTDEDFDEISELELYLNEIPDYLALGVTTEYQRLKQELQNREDI